KAPELLRLYHERWKEKVQQLQSDQAFDGQRLEQEVALWVAKSDFTEEVDRIRHHLKSFDDILNKGGECGRRLEFLIQELHREVNTLGSKCPEVSYTSSVVELKSLLERMREQSLNVE